MNEPEFKLGQIVEPLDLTVWNSVDEQLPRDAVLAYVFARALGALLGPDGAPLRYEHLRNLSEDACARDSRALGAHWRDGAAVVVNIGAHEVLAILRHGPVFRLMSRVMQ